MGVFLPAYFQQICFSLHWESEREGKKKKWFIGLIWVRTKTGSEINSFGKINRFAIILFAVSLSLSTSSLNRSWNISDDLTMLWWKVVKGNNYYPHDKWVMNHHFSLPSLKTILLIPSRPGEPWIILVIIYLPESVACFLAEKFGFH